VAKVLFERYARSLYRDRRGRVYRLCEYDGDTNRRPSESGSVRIARLITGTMWLSELTDAVIFYDARVHPHGAIAPPQRICAAFLLARDLNLPILDRAVTTCDKWKRGSEKWRDWEPGYHPLSATYVTHTSTIRGPDNWAETTFGCSAIMAEGWHWRDNWRYILALDREDYKREKQERMQQARDAS
jgi:hypothetical protein